MSIDLKKSTIKTDNRRIRFIICLVCKPPHVSNCPNCFGYGFKDFDGGVPIATGEIEQYHDSSLPYFSCSVCGGNPYNEHIKTD